MRRSRLFRPFLLVVSVLALMAVLVAAPAGAGSPPPLYLTPASGPVGTTVTVSSEELPVVPGPRGQGECAGGSGSLFDLEMTRGAVDVDVTDPDGEDVPNTEPYFTNIVGSSGDWFATFTVPAGLAPGDKITVAATCVETDPVTGQQTNTFHYEPAVFTVTATATNGGGTTTTTTGIPTISSAGVGTTPVATPLGVQPRFTG